MVEDLYLVPAVIYPLKVLIYILLYHKVSCGLVECQSHLYVCVRLSTGVGFMWPGWMSISPVCVSSSVHRCWFHVAWSNVNLTCMCVFLCPQVLVSCGLVECQSHLYVCLPLSTGVGFMWPGRMSISPVCVSSSVHRCWFHVAWPLWILSVPILVSLLVGHAQP